MSEIKSFNDLKKRYPIQPNNKEMLLGRGTYGTVIKVEDQITNEWVAIKISEYKGVDRRSLKNEVELTNKVPLHANIAIYKDCYRLDTGLNISDFALMQYYRDGNLSELLKTQTLSGQQKEEIIRGILQGLGHLHSHKIVHRDLKPANILIAKDSAGKFIPKIADFGLSKMINLGDADNSDFGMSDGAGTPSYKAPEQIIGGEAKYNLDLWAFGVILFELITGEKPFVATKKEGSEQSSKLELEKKIVNVLLPDAKLNAILEPYQTIIRRCLVKDINLRARRASELLEILDGVEHLYQKAAQLLENKDYASLNDICNVIIAKKPNDKKALEYLKQADEKINAEKIELLLAKALELENTKQYAAALELYEGLKQNTDYIKSREALCKEALGKLEEIDSLTNKAEQLLQNNDLEKAYKIFETILSLEPGHLKAKTKVEFIAEKIVANKIAEAEELSKQGQYQASSNILLGSKYYGSFETRIKAILTKNNELKNIWETAERHFASKNYQKSQESYNVLQKKNPNHVGLESKLREIEAFLNEEIEVTDVFDVPEPIPRKDQPLIQKSTAKGEKNNTNKTYIYILGLSILLAGVYFYYKSNKHETTHAIIAEPKLIETSKPLTEVEISVKETEKEESNKESKKQPTVITTDNKYTDNISQAKYFQAKGDYKKAINYAQKALLFKPNDSEANQILRYCNNAIKASENSGYNNYITQASNYKVTGDYNNAITAAQKALSFKPNDSRAIQIINQCEAELIAAKKQNDDRQKNEKIKKLIANARGAYDNGDYMTAKAYCDAAQQLNPDGTLAGEVSRLTKAIKLMIN